MTQNIKNTLPASSESAPESRQGKQLKTGNCELWAFPRYSDPRGNLYVVDFAKSLPFQPQRTFLVTDVPQEKIRGEHAHHKCQQFLIALKGSLSVIIDDGTRKEEVILSCPEQGLWLKPLVWGVQLNFTNDAILQVYASDAYDPQDYIHGYDEFLQITAR